MDDFLKLVDELRKRGAIKISSRQYTVEFSQALITETPITNNREEFTHDAPIKDLEGLMYLETSKL